MNLATNSETEIPAPRKKPTPAERIISMASQCLQKSGGDVKQATELMEQKINTNATLFRALMGPLVQTACYSQISRLCRQNRQRIWVTPNYGEPSGDRVENLSRGNIEMLMEFPLPNAERTPIGKANREQVKEAAEFYLKQSTDMGFKARWLELVANSVDGDALVKDALSEERLRALQEQARAQ